MGHYLGLGKVKYSSSVASLRDLLGGDFRPCDAVVYLSERILRQKASGAWPSQALSLLQKEMIESDFLAIGENRDVDDPLAHERALNKGFPFFDYLQSHDFTKYSREFNSDILFFTHHLAHAYVAQMMSPFEKSLVYVFDGAGTRQKDFARDHPESEFLYSGGDNHVEENSTYLLDRDKLICVEKNWHEFKKSTNHSGQIFSRGLGIFYEKIAEFIFNSNQAAGKVMGLAPFGSASNIQDKLDFLEQLDWECQAFRGKNKKDWESGPHQKLYQDLAASAQLVFESETLDQLKLLRERYPDYSNLILIGGCALNCTTNQKIVDTNLFDKVYVPPFPGDGAIALGCAYGNYRRSKNYQWSGLSFEEQQAYMGPLSSRPDQWNIPKIFEKYDCCDFNSSNEEEVLKALLSGEVVAWFQGRSESGPRALGNRSLLASVETSGVKDYLNSHIKFRESFRPYGCSVTYEDASTYFDIADGFDNPYMSFAVRVKKTYRELLKEVSHVDGTSRMQTVREGQNIKFHQLLKSWGDFSGHPILLNTSLNKMGEPIVETPIDAYEFFKDSNVKILVIGDYLIKK